MTDIAANLNQLARRAYEQASPFRIRRVERVLPGGAGVLINLTNPDGLGVGFEVPCMSSYVNRAVGDKVLMLTTDERGWVIFGKIGPPDDGSVQARIDALEAEIEALRDHHPEPLPQPIPDIETPDITVDPPNPPEESDA